MSQDIWLRRSPNPNNMWSGRSAIPREPDSILSAKEPTLIEMSGAFLVLGSPGSGYCKSEIGKYTIPHPGSLDPISGKSRSWFWFFRQIWESGERGCTIHRFDFDGVMTELCGVVLVVMRCGEVVWFHSGFARSFFQHFEWTLHL